MPYSVQLVRKNKSVHVDLRVYAGPTPKQGEMIDVKTTSATYRAKVIGVATIPAKSPVTESVDHVTAEEV
jgi:hypothetical protein